MSKEIEQNYWMSQCAASVGSLMLSANWYNWESHNMQIWQIFPLRLFYTHYITRATIPSSKQYHMFNTPTWNWVNKGLYFLLYCICKKQILNFMEPRSLHLPRKDNRSSTGAEAHLFFYEPTFMHEWSVHLCTKLFCFTYSSHTPKAGAWDNLHSTLHFQTASFRITSRRSHINTERKIIKAP